MAKLTVKRQLARFGLAGLTALALSGCGPQFDPPSKLQSLRILAVKKDHPYLVPPAIAGDATYDPSGQYASENTVHLTAAIEDAQSVEDKRYGLQKLWFAGCNNPARDNYFSCLLNVWLSFKAFKEFMPNGFDAGTTTWSPSDVKNSANNVDLTRLYLFLLDTFPSVVTQAASASDASGQGTSAEELSKQALALKVGTGDSFDYTIPPWLIEQHAPPAQSTLPRYGLSNVFFAVCDGVIDFAPGWETVADPFEILTDATRGFPLSCYDPITRTERGPDHFMVSYSSVFAYETITNKNPVIGGITFDGQPVDPAAYCIGEACAEASGSTTTDSNSGNAETSGSTTTDSNSGNAETSGSTTTDGNSGNAGTSGSTTTDGADGQGQLGRDCAAEPLAKVLPRCLAASDDDCKEVEISPVLDPALNSEGDVVASRAGGGDDGLLEQMWIRYFASAGKIKNDAKRLQDATEGWFAEHKTKWSIPRTTGLAHVWAVAYDNRGGVDWVRVSVCVQ